MCTASRYLLVLWSIMLLSGQATAGTAEPIFRFAIPPQSLATALSDYSRAVQQTVLFNPRSLAGIETGGISGSYTAGEAIEQLLRNTSLEAEKLNQGWLIQPAHPPPASVPASGPAPKHFIDEVIVVGSHAPDRAEALLRKRRANQRQEVILADEIERLPALNIAEVAQRASGVSVVRDRGEALFVSIRGLPTEFSQLNLNGNTLASNENVRTSEQYGRRFRYDVMPAELVAGIEVKKSSTAADPEGAIGGRINLRNHEPLSLQNNLFTAKISAGQSGLAGEIDPSISVLGGWTNPDQDLGLVVSGLSNEKHLRQDRALNFRWQQMNPAAAGEAGLSPGGVRPTLELEARQRRGVSAVAGWRPNSHSKLAINLMSLQQETEYREFSYSADYSAEDLKPAVAQWRGTALIGGATEAGSVQISHESTDLIDKLQAMDLVFEQGQGPWHYRAQLAYSQARSRNGEPIRRTRLRRESDVSFGFYYPPGDQNAVPSIHYEGLALTDAQAFPGRRLEGRIMKAKDSQRSFGIDLVRSSLLPGIESFSSGIKLNRHVRDYWRRDWLFTDGIEGHYFPDTYFSTFPVDDFLSRAQGELPTHWLVPDEERFWSGVDFEKLMNSPPSRQDLLNTYRVEEDVAAAYLQVNLGTGPLRGNLGLRYSHTEQTSFGHWLKSGSGTDAVRFDNDYGHLLPSLNLAWELGDDYVWRLAAGRAINRPDLQDLAPRLSTNSGDQKLAVGGNPTLRPVTAWQYDTALEWYFGERGLLSLSLFYTDLRGFVQPQTSNLRLAGEDYQLTSKGNGGSARVHGLELDYQHLFPIWPFSGHDVGIRINGAWVDSIAEYRQDGGATLRDRLADVARRTLNLSVFYESRGCDLRLHYSWRDKVLKEVGTADLAAQNIAAFGTLDGHASFHVTDQWHLFLQGINLLGAAEQEFVGEGEFAGYTYYGRTYVAGLKLTF